MIVDSMTFEDIYKMVLKDMDSKFKQRCMQIAGDNKYRERVYEYFFERYPVVA